MNCIERWVNCHTPIKYFCPTSSELEGVLWPRYQLISSFLCPVLPLALTKNTLTFYGAKFLDNYPCSSLNLLTFFLIPTLQPPSRLPLSNTILLASFAIRICFSCIFILLMFNELSTASLISNHKPHVKWFNTMSKPDLSFSLVP